eukprot:TRINITY_DN68025_c0_g1_i1.p1 TRINITY_DN68025_c0_g1~~TRINITY_DN68025_c0_g1_i1.p1  ORF type:complete len:164 (+),score=31.67 TRINITY_DN68025_c0_g1_i1:68-493(+)
MHVGYSMNWPTEVFGTCLLDYPCRLSSKWATDLLLKDTLLVLLLTHGPSIGRGLFVTPAFTSPLNITAFFLGLAFMKNWVTHFKDKANFFAAYLDLAKDKVCHATYESDAVNTQLTRLPSPVLDFTWTYDIAVVNKGWLWE